MIAEIHRSDMTKLGPDGSVSRRADGKVLKDDHYEAPDVSAVLRRQGWAPRTPDAAGTPQRPQTLQTPDMAEPPRG